MFNQKPGYQGYSSESKMTKNTSKSADALSRNTPKYDGDVIRARRGFGGPEVVVDHSDEV